MQQSGNLCFYKLERQTSTLEKVVYQSELKDSEGGALTQKVTCFEISSITTPRFDSKTNKFNRKLARQDSMRQRIESANDELGIKEASETSSIQTDSSMRDVVEEDQWIVFGMSRGQLIFFSIFDMSYLHSRYDVATAEVTAVREIIKYNSFLVLDKENVLTLCEFQDDKVLKYHQVKTFRPVFDIQMHQS